MSMTLQTEKTTVKRDYKDPELLTINTLENAIYMSMQNDLSLELMVDVLNINVGYNKELMGACKTLGEYSEYVSRVREYAKEMSIEDAVDRAIDACIREDILREFLERNRAEARAMSIYEYDQEEHIRLEREDAFEDGRKAGREEGIEKGLLLGVNKKLKELVEKKVKKGLSASEIADMLEEDLSVITAIMEESESLK